MSQYDPFATVEPKSFFERAPAIAQRATTLLPFVRFLPRHPAVWLGAAAVGVVGTLAWRNRAKIAAKAGPVLQNAADRARPMIEGAQERLPWTRSSGTPAGVAADLK